MFLVTSQQTRLSKTKIIVGAKIDGIVSMHQRAQGACSFFIIELLLQVAIEKFVGGS